MKRLGSGRIIYFGGSGSTTLVFTIGVAMIFFGSVSLWCFFSASSNSFRILLIYSSLDKPVFEPKGAVASSYICLNTFVAIRSSTSALLNSLPINFEPSSLGRSIPKYSFNSWRKVSGTYFFLITLSSRKSSN